MKKLSFNFFIHYKAYNFTGLSVFTTNYTFEIAYSIDYYVSGLPDVAWIHLSYINFTISL